jgi:hypothetical protein
MGQDKDLNKCLSLSTARSPALVYQRRLYGGEMSVSQSQRKALAPHVGGPFTVLGLYTAYSQARNEFAYDTLLLKQVTDENRFPICDHLWLKAPKFIPANIRPGDLIMAHGRINEYRRIDGSTDYTLFVFSLRKGVKE